MASIEHRISKLEQANGIGLNAICGVHDMTDAQLEGILRSWGISTTSEDLEASLKRLVDGDPLPWAGIDGSRLAETETLSERNAKRLAHFLSSKSE